MNEDIQHRPTMRSILAARQRNRSRQEELRALSQGSSQEPRYTEERLTAELYRVIDGFGSTEENQTDISRLRIEAGQLGLRGKAVIFNEIAPLLEGGGIDGLKKKVAQAEAVAPLLDMIGGPEHIHALMEELGERGSFMGLYGRRTQPTAPYSLVPPGTVGEHVEHASPTGGVTGLKRKVAQRTAPPWLRLEDVTGGV